MSDSINLQPAIDALNECFAKIEKLKRRGKIGEITINRVFITDAKVRKLFELFEQSNYDLVLKANGVFERRYTIIERVPEETTEETDE